MLKRQLKTFFQLTAISAAIIWSAPSVALQNGNFSSGFDNWTGEVSDVDTFSITPIDPLPGGYSDNYQILGGGLAQLNTTSTNNPPNDIWSVALFQDFLIPDLSVLGNSLELSLSVSWSLSDLGLDFASAQLVDLADPLSTLSLAGGGKFDITGWAGKNASLQFVVQDGDDQDDWLQVGNISITEKTAAIPEPTTWLLILTGCFALRRKIF
jgi:hypothetical protein